MTAVIRREQVAPRDASGGAYWRQIAQVNQTSRSRKDSSEPKSDTSEPMYDGCSLQVVSNATSHSPQPTARNTHRNHKGRS